MAAMIHLVKIFLLSKIALYVVIAVGIVLGLFAWAEQSGRVGLEIMIVPFLFFSPYFIASIALSSYLTKKYRRFLKKGKSITVDYIASSLGRKDIDSLKSELQYLIDRGYLPGITIDDDTNRISHTAVKDVVQELGKTVKKTVSAFKTTSSDTEETDSVCKKCGAAIPDNGVMACEFCGSPISQ